MMVSTKNLKQNNLAKQLIKLLIEKNWQIATAESCTGGLIASTITSVCGSSNAFGYGLVTYCNEAKIKLLGVESESLDKFGAVSEQVAKQMVLGIQKLSGSDIAISATGIAGPTGDENKPVGLIFLGFAINEQTWVKKIQLSGNRKSIQNQTVIFALNTIIDLLASKAS